MKKIVFFSGGIDRSGGIERVLSIVASGLAKSGYDVTIVSMCGEKRSHYELDVNVKTLFMEAPDFSQNIHKNIKKLSGIIDSIEPDYWVDVDIILSLYTYFVRKKHKNVKKHMATIQETIINTLSAMMLLLSAVLSLMN